MDLRNEVKKQLVDGVIHPLSDPRVIGLYAVEEAVIFAEFWDIEQRTCKIWNASDMVPEIALTVPNNEAWSLGALLGTSLEWLTLAEEAIIGKGLEDYAVGNSSYGETIGRSVGGVLYVASGSLTWNTAGLPTFAVADNGFELTTMAPSSDSPRKLAAGSSLYFGRFSPQ